MRAAVMSGYGDPDVLSLATVDVPEPGPGQIRVAVRFAGAGPTDVAIRAASTSSRPCGERTSP